MGEAPSNADFKVGELVLTQSPKGWIEAEITKCHADGTVDLHVKHAEDLDPPLNPFAVHVPVNLIQKMKRDIVNNRQEAKVVFVEPEKDDIGGTLTNFLSSDEEFSYSESEETTTQPPNLQPKKSREYIDAAESLFTMLDEMEALRKQNEELQSTCEILKKKNRTLIEANERLRTSQTGQMLEKVEFLERQNEELQRALEKRHGENEKLRKSIRVNENELNLMGLQITNVRLKHKSDVTKLHELRQKVSSLQETNMELAKTLNNTEEADTLFLEIQKQDELLISQTLLQEENERLNEHLRMLKDNKMSRDDQMFKLISASGDQRKEFETEEGRFLAEREHFFLTCVSCQINLHDQFESDEATLALDMSNSVLTENPEEIWKLARRDQVPMNQFHNYITDYLTQRMKVKRDRRELQTLEEDRGVWNELWTRFNTCYKVE